MNKYLVIFPLLFVALATPKVSRADQTYNVNFNVGPDTITGTIVTNGDTGSFIQLDSFSFGIGRSISSSTGGSSAQEGKGAGSIAEIVVSGNALTATATGLYFNFDDVEQSSLTFLDTNDTFLWCLFTNEGCDPPGGGEVLTVGDTTLTITGLTGNQLIGTVATAPEPGTLGLMLIGFVGLMLGARKRFTRGLRLSAGTH
jgi:PEP-CTERM motif